MTDAPRADLVEHGARARVTAGDRSWEDVPVVPLDEAAPEPADLAVPALIVRPAFPTAIAVLPGERIADVELFLDGSRVRVREIRERKAKGDPFWSKVFSKKKGA